MTERNIYNSSGKIIGNVKLQDNKILVTRNRAPSLNCEIPSDEVGDYLFSCSVSEEICKKLWDVYNLTIGEIAAILNVPYCKANRCCKISEWDTSAKFGRRNSSAGNKFSQERINHIKEGQKAFWENGGYVKPYIRTPEIRAKISEGVKLAAKEGRGLTPQEVSRKGWRNHKFDNVNFKRGIGGYITSKKINKRFFFRSLLELYYILQIEDDNEIKTYQYEPFQIPLDNGGVYTPDFLLDNTYVIELKSYKFVYSQGGEIQKKFEYKVTQAQKYCVEHEYAYRVVFDKDIGFDSGSFKHWIVNNENMLKLYQIEFAQPERIWSPKQQNWQKMQPQNFTTGTNVTDTGSQKPEISTTPISTP